MNLTGAKVIGYFSIPHPSLAETNPDAYNGALKNLPPGAGSCANCGMGILHHVIVMNPDGKKYFIGSECAQKVGDTKMRQAVRAKITAEQAENIEASRKAKVEEYFEKATLDSQKKQERIKKWFWVVEELLGSKSSWQRTQCADGWIMALTPSGNRLFYMADSFGRISAHGSTFVESISADLISGFSISERASNIICEILSKRHGRMGSKNYNAAFNDYSIRLQGISA